MRRSLVCHPSARGDAIAEVTVDVALDGETLVVAYRIVGTGLRIPDAPLDPLRLWAHTCGELFVMPAGGEAYVEHNFSPSGQAARFEFSGYRQRTSAQHADAAVVATHDGRTLQIDARAALPSRVAAARIALTAVVEDQHGARSYWALRHPSERPDFHHPGGFALSLTVGATPAIVDIA
ncbi:MAG TPA: hypothetical protein VG755_39385 [Nannocystaceae bacterium]|nr:hypothetical protein [Nannocystaceae bacterium]